MENILSPIVILGGGAAGLAAASMAVRMGQHVLLAEREAFFGGQYRQAGAESMMGFASCQSVTELRSLSAFSDSEGRISFDIYSEWADSILLHPKVDTLIHTSLSSVKVRDGEISRLDLASPQGRISVKPEVVIDATGTGMCAISAGVPYLPGDGKGLVMPPVLCLTAENADRELFLMKGIGIFHPESDLFAEIRTKTDRNGKIRVNLVRKGNYSGDLSAKESSGLQIGVRRDIRQAEEMIRRLIPGMSEAELIPFSYGYLLPEGPHPSGCHVLSEEEVSSGTVFDDWAVGRLRTNDGSVCCSLPYGSFVTREIRNLILAGRCLSMESGAFKKLRGLSFSLASGNAAGCAAVLSLAYGGRVKKIDMEYFHEALSDLGMAAPEKKHSDSSDK
jgi:hypothetical protein